MERLFQKFDNWVNGPEIAIFHEFKKPPYGGGNQFLLALEGELERRGLSVGRNRVGKRTRVCLFNSYNFDFHKLAALKQKFPPLRMIHRVDGPIGAYRGTDEAKDREIWQLNHELADATIFQSHYSLEKHRELGLEFKEPHVILNASDPETFNRQGRIPPPTDRKVKLIATAWSDNPKKGGPTLAWLDEHLDYERYTLTFVGRTQAAFKHALLMSPVPSHELAKLLKEHDIYIAASENDPCSNALIEALSCGLPAAYRLSGGHPELVGEGGVGFPTPEELLTAIETITANFPAYQSRIAAPSLPEATDQYLSVFNL